MKKSIDVLKRSKRDLGETSRSHLPDTLLEGFKRSCNELMSHLKFGLKKSEQLCQSFETVTVLCDRLEWDTALSEKSTDIGLTRVWRRMKDRLGSVRQLIPKWTGLIQDSNWSECLATLTQLVGFGALTTFSIISLQRDHMLMDQEMLLKWGDMIGPAKMEVLTLLQKFTIPEPANPSVKTLKRGGLMKADEGRDSGSHHQTSFSLESDRASLSPKDKQGTLDRFNSNSVAKQRVISERILRTVRSRLDGYEREHAEASNPMAIPDQVIA
jgi:hypothetical protein